ncbi:MAG: dihydrolipoamide acetyltransferase family protein [Pirellulales bacterium]
MSLSHFASTEVENRATAARADRVVASPRARRAMRQHALDPRRVRGSGPGGRIVEADVLAAVGQAGAAPSMRRGIARRTSESFATAPHFYLRAEADMSLLIALRQRLIGPIQEQAGVRLTLTDLILRAQARGLRDCPRANRVWHNDAVVQMPSVDVGLVVALDDGLLVGMIRQADQLPLDQLARKRSELVSAARAGRLPAAAMGGGASSLTNLGPGRVDEFAAVLMPPQSTMLATGSIAARPFVLSNQLTVRPTLRLTLSVDHRVLDGGPAAAFLSRIVECLERPELLL